MKNLLARLKKGFLEKRVTLPSDSSESQGYVIAIPRGDPDMGSATQMARTTISEFVDHLRSPKATEEYFAVKAKLSGESKNEYIWIYDVTYDGVSFIGKLDSPSEMLPNKKVGDKFSVKADEIFDWMFVDDGKLVGGYTIRVARTKMTPEQRKKLDQALWYRID